jgi:ribosomal protein S18 acetylase RimI-like enzyme
VPTEEFISLIDSRLKWRVFDKIILNYQSIIGSGFMSVEVQYASIARLSSFQLALGEVARERIYLQLIDAPEMDKLLKFQKRLIDNNWPTFFALANERVVGWIDISPMSNPRLAHRGELGMGILKEFRGVGVGTQLLEAALGHSKKIGLEKIELNVYTSNLTAIALYIKFGFQQSGYIAHYRKLDDKYYDCLFMDLFL